MKSLPTAGFVRLAQIIGQQPITPEQAAANRAAGRPNQRPRQGIAPILPISAATWWRGVAHGRFPQPIKLGAATFWRVEDVLTLVAAIGCETGPRTDEKAWR